MAAEKYTVPVIQVQRLADGRIQTGLGSAVIVNREGWILTAAHIVKAFLKRAIDRSKLAELEQKRQAVEQHTGLTLKAKRKRLKRIVPDPGWLTDLAVRCIYKPSLDSHLVDVTFNELADLAVARIANFDSSVVKTYPVFKNPKGPMLPGTSLCRVGFPFTQIRATFDEKTRGFHLPRDAFPIPRFPNDGIHTRLVIQKSQDGSQQAKFIETSSPGLRGQSGGPIFDRKARVWAIQSQTQSLELGFTPEVRQGNRKIVEHQFMHVGWGSHVEEIIDLLNDRGISFDLSED